ncbi:MAG TPA: ParB/RepB/Spo0J family partition protein [Ktedonobacterales bacterium]
MAIAVTIGTVPLEEIHELGWPTDRHLVLSFRRTLQQGGHFAPMQLNRVWQPEAPWRYEIIDGFHRFEAAKAEGVIELLCQVVEIGLREARYARIQACVGKPAEITRARALQELRLAYIADMRALIGNPLTLMEPVLGEDGQVHARPRAMPLPTEPLAALEAFTDHLIVTQGDPLPALVTSDQQSTITFDGLQAGWERTIAAWMAELGQRFGYDADWLLQELHIHSLQAQGLGQGWNARQRESFQRQGGYAFHALLLWKIPDVEVRAWFRRQIQADPAKGEWIWKTLQALGFQGPQSEGKPFKTLPKSILLTLLTRYPSPRDLYLAVRDRLEGPPPPPAPLPQPPTVSRSPSPVAPPAAPPKSLPAPPKETRPESAIFAVGSPSFVGQPPAPSLSGAALPPPNKPVVQAPNKPVVQDPVSHALEALASPPTLPRPDLARAYQPVHVACMALVQAIEELSAHYGQEWRQWDQAQADLAEVRALLA